MKFIYVITMMAFASQHIKGQNTTIMVPTVSSNASQVYNNSNMTNTTTVSITSTPVQSTSLYQTSTSTPVIIKPTPSSSVTIRSSSISSNNSTHGEQKPVEDDLTGNVTLYLLIACVGLFLIIIIILIILVVQMKRLTNKLKR